jgi:uncharacterized protein YggT (Ycf19 family)
LEDGMIDAINFVIARLFDLVFYPFREMNPWIGMVAISLLTALLMLLVYRLTSRQDELRTVKNRILAHLLEFRLYKDNLSQTFSALGSVLWYNLKYLGCSARPLAVMIVPLVLLLIQLDLWFGYASLTPGEAAVVKVRLQDGHRPSREAVAVQPSQGLVIETLPLRIDTEGEVDWRIRATKPGIQELAVVVNDGTVAKRVEVGSSSLSRVSPARVARGWYDQLVNPGEPAISESSAVRRIEIGYPARRMTLLGRRVHWLVAYFLLSLVFAFAFKGLFKVEI